MSVCSAGWRAVSPSWLRCMWLHSAGLSTGEVQQRMASAISEDGLDGTVSSVENVDRSGTCGNGECEIGERCVNDADAACCPADCPFATLACPSQVADAACSGHGTCAMDSGTCLCFAEVRRHLPVCACMRVFANSVSWQAGYAGDDCSECQPGYRKSGTSCVWYGAGTTPRSFVES